MEIPRHWRLKQQRYSLVGEVCPHCDYKIFPPRDVCPNCGKEAKDLYTFSGKGEVYSYTTIYEAPSGYDVNAPYTVALVKLGRSHGHSPIDRSGQLAGGNRNACGNGHPQNAK